MSTNFLKHIREILSQFGRKVFSLKVFNFKVLIAALIGGDHPKEGGAYFNARGVIRTKFQNSQIIINPTFFSILNFTKKALNKSDSNQI